MKHFIVAITISLFILIVFNPLKFKYNYDLMNNYFMKENVSKSFTKEEILYVKENRQNYMIHLSIFNDIQIFLIIILLLSSVKYFIIKEAHYE